jgi:hypothetical protein
MALFDVRLVINLRTRNDENWVSWSYALGFYMAIRHILKINVNSRYVNRVLHVQGIE